MHYVMCYSIPSVELACHHIMRLVVAGVRRVQGPVQQAILVTNWDNGISTAFDVTVASPLNSSTITEAGMYSGAAARAAELRKHTQNDSKYAELSWKCIPLAVECYGACHSFSHSWEYL